VFVKQFKSRQEPSTFEMLFSSSPAVSLRFASFRSLIITKSLTRSQLRMARSSVNCENGRADLPSSSSLMSLAACIPSSLRFFSICLLRANAARSSALIAQPILAQKLDSGPILTDVCGRSSTQKQCNHRKQLSTRRSFGFVIEGRHHEQFDSKRYGGSGSIKRRRSTEKSAIDFGVQTLNTRASQVGFAPFDWSSKR
jgi:hypothetical protein